MHATAVLLATAAALGAGHTLVGIDHSLPFVLLARAEGWSLRRLWVTTAACGLAHVLGSVLVGGVGIGLGAALGEIQGLERWRGVLAARLLVGLGLAYAAWGLWRALRGRRHVHPHAHADGTLHVHDHDHAAEHAHAHSAHGGRTLTTLGLFVVLVLGPCEALVPMLLAPAFDRSWWLVAGVAVVFAASTVATMLVLVTAGHLGLRLGRLPWLDRYVHAVSGVAIAASGVLVEALGV
jgi:ABC-type nickel/cobalt efflux system permease component RcnA